MRQSHRNTLEEVEQNQQQKVTLVLLRQLKEALRRPLLSIQRRYVIVEGKGVAAHEARGLAGGRGAVDAGMLAAVFEHNAVHSRAGVCMSVVGLFAQRVGGALVWY